jgi:hypothetical protein
MTQIDAGRATDGPRRRRTRVEMNGRVRPADGGSSPEGRFLAGPGKSLNRQVAEGKDRKAALTVREHECRSAADQAEEAASARQAHHCGGDHTWLLRLIIVVAIVAEGMTAFVGMEILVSSMLLAVGLAALAAAVGTGMACALANRRLNRTHVPNSARVLEGIFVGVLTALRYASLHVQGAGLVAAAGGAALAALISALALLGIEEILVETQTFSIFAGVIRLSFLRWRCARTASRLERTEASLESTVERIQQLFLAFLLKEGSPLKDARCRAAAFKSAIVNSED